MKKKNLIIPGILLVVSLAAMFFLTFFMSPFVPYAAFDVDLSLNSNPIYVRHYDNVCSFAEKAVKYSENESTVYIAMAVFSPAGYKFNSYNYPEDYVEKCLVYNQLALDYMEKKNTNNIYEGPYNYFTGFKSGFFGEESADAYCAARKQLIKGNVAYSLFLLGRVDEAKDYIETMIKDFKSKPDDAKNGFSGSDTMGFTNEYFSRFLGIDRLAFLTYFSETSALSNDESYKAWVLEKEIEITEYLKDLDGGKGEILSPELYQTDNIFNNRSYEDIAKVYNSN